MTTADQGVDAPDGITLMRLRNSGERAVFHPSAEAEVDPQARRADPVQRVCSRYLRKRQFGWAVAEGFEPPDGFRRLSLSRRVHWAALPRHRRQEYGLHAAGLAHGGR